MSWGSLAMACGMQPHMLVKLAHNAAATHEFNLALAIQKLHLHMVASESLLGFASRGKLCSSSDGVLCTDCDGPLFRACACDDSHLVLASLGSQVLLGAFGTAVHQFCASWSLLGVRVALDIDSHPSVLVEDLCDFVKCLL